MSWSSSGRASKSSRLRAATGAANVRKPNPAARTGRFSPRPQTDGESDNLFSVWFSTPDTLTAVLSFPCFVSLFAFLYSCLGVFPPVLWFTFANFTFSRTEALLIRIPLSETWKSLRKIRRMVARKHLATSLSFASLFSLSLSPSVCMSCCLSASLPLALSFSSQPGGLQSFKVYFLLC